MLRRDDDRVQVFKIAKQMTTTNQDTVGEKCVRNDRSDLATSDQEKHLAWKEHYQKLLKEEFDWDKDNFSVNSSIIGPRPQIGDKSVRKTLHKVR